jgi:hypothetical protein
MVMGWKLIATTPIGLSTETELAQGADDEHPFGEARETPERLDRLHLAVNPCRQGAEALLELENQDLLERADAF